MAPEVISLDTNKCPECGGDVYEDRREVSCNRCGLVVSAIYTPRTEKVAKERVKFFTEPGTRDCDRHLVWHDKKVSMLKVTALDNLMVNYIKAKSTVNTRKLWEVFGDKFPNKKVFYVTLRRLKDQKRISQGYVSNED